MRLHCPVLIFLCVSSAGKDSSNEPKTGPASSQKLMHLFYAERGNIMGHGLAALSCSIAKVAQAPLVCPWTRTLYAFTVSFRRFPFFAAAWNIVKVWRNGTGI